MAKIDPIDRHVGQRIKRRRRILGMSQIELGKQLGLSYQQVQKYETGQNRISASRLYQIAEILDTPVYDFFAGLDSPAHATEAEAVHINREVVDLTNCFVRLAEPVRITLLDHVRALAAALAPAAER